MPLIPLYPVLPDDGPAVTSHALWMTLFRGMADLCTDARPEVRKSANQTLVSTLTTHGPRLPLDTWCVASWPRSRPSLCLSRA